MSEFELLEVIGRGSFGQIRKVRRITDGRILVRKEISYKGMNTKERMQLLAETKILRSLIHPNVVQYIDHHHSAEDHMMYLYMEYCGGGDLAGLIRQCRNKKINLSENMVWRIFTQLILALYRCHYNEDPPATGALFSSNGADDDDSYLPPPNPSIVILHRDIKPDNVFFMNNGYSVKLGDFGLAKILDQEHFLANTYVGTPFYMSPEVLLDQPYTMQSDIWSLGCVIYELCALHPPFQAKSHIQLEQKIHEGVFTPLPDCYSSTLSRTVAACLNVNQSMRPNTATLLRLDVIKLCRREMDLMAVEQDLNELQAKLTQKDEELSLREAEIARKQAELTQQIEKYNDYINEDLAKVIETEVNKRLRQQQERLQDITNAAPVLTAPLPDQTSSSSGSGNASPADISMMSLAPETPIPSRNLRGPRTFRVRNMDPVRQEQLLDDELPVLEPSALDSDEPDVLTAAQDRSSSRSTSAFSAESGTGSTRSVSSSSTASCASSQQSYATAISSSIMSRNSADPEAHQSDAYKDQKENNVGGLGVGGLTTRMRMMDVKSMGGVKGRNIMDIQRSKLTQMDKVWAEDVHGDDMPSPFLRKWEKQERRGKRVC